MPRAITDTNACIEVNEVRRDGLDWPFVSFKISLARILIGIVLFTVLLFLTRLFQRWMREAILIQPRVDAGVANSIDTAFGYAGTIVAALIAISYAGLDVTNLAIVAGALGKTMPGVGMTTFRMPVTPVSFGALAGMARGAQFEPVRTTPLHDGAVSRGAVFEDAGQWKRARYFPLTFADGTRETMAAAVAREC